MKRPTYNELQEALYHASQFIDMRYDCPCLLGLVDSVEFECKKCCKWESEKCWKRYFIEQAQEK